MFPNRTFSFTEGQEEEKYKQSGCSLYTKMVEYQHVVKSGTNHEGRKEEATSEQKVVVGASLGDGSDDEDCHASFAVAAASTTSGGGKVGGGGKRKALDRANLSEKKICRLEKNRMSARECRRQKKEAIQQLEQ